MPSVSSVLSILDIHDIGSLVTLHCEAQKVCIEKAKLRNMTFVFKSNRRES